MTFQPTLRRLLLAKSAPAANGDPATGHLCLFPTTEEDARARAGSVERGFACACGEVFDATLELSSYTTEYEKRCLNAFKPWFGHETDRRMR